MFSPEVWADVSIIAEPLIVPGQAVVSFLVHEAGRTRLAVAPIDGGPTEWLPLSPPVVGVPSSGLGAYGWLPTGSALVYIGVDGRLHWHGVSTGACRPLTVDSAPLSGLAVSPTESQVAVVVDTQFVCVLTSLDHRQGLTSVSTSADFALDPAWSPDGRLLAWHEWESPNMPWHKSRVVVRPVDLSLPPATASSGEYAVAQPRFSPGGERLGFLCDHGGWLNLWEVPLPPDLERPFGKPSPLVASRAELAPPSWGPGLRTWAWINEHEVVVWRNEDGGGAFERWRDGVVSAVLRDGVVVQGVASSDAGVAAVISGPATWPRVEVFEGEKRSVVALSGPTAVERTGTAPESVSWSSDGYTIRARLYRPSTPEENPPPLMVWLHQGPTGQSLATLEPRIAYFVERGWSVLAPDFRGSTGWGRAFMLALDGLWGKADVTDVAAGIALALQEGWGAAGRVVLYGGSAGGFLTLRLLATRPDLCSAGIVLSPVCNLTDEETPPWRYQAHYVERLLGGRPAERSELAERSPLKHPERIRRPVLILHGADDHIVPAWHSRALADAIDAAGGVAERQVYEGEGHGWVGGATLADELHRVESFLDRHVLCRAPGEAMHHDPPG